MEISAYSRFIRTIAKLPQAREIKTPCVVLPIDLADEIFGYYDGGTETTSFYFAQQSFFYFDSTTAVWTRQIYKQIKSVYLPDASSASKTMELRRVDGLSSIILHIDGEQGKYRDVFEVGRFFMRIIDNS